MLLIENVNVTHSSPGKDKHGWLLRGSGEAAGLVRKQKQDGGRSPGQRFCWGFCGRARQDQGNGSGPAGLHVGGSGLWRSSPVIRYLALGDGAGGTWAWSVRVS